ncbi:MAG TPA: response regulator transcription factor [Saprospiraceae bacterium]|nr:response regulator transcription factor [Saprospiraceae bacterium]HMQ83850.1 response regulator transcription factor [Saprospiraceae bacterium]
MQAIPIILADAHYLVRLGLKQLLAENTPIEVVVEAENEADLLQKVAAYDKVLVILDYNHADRFSTETVKKIKQHHPGAQILIISADNNKDSIYQVLESGVNSFITKTCDEKEIIDAVYATAKGERFFCAKVLDYILQRSFSKPEEENCQPAPLSVREMEIVRLISKGYISKEIADQLNISTHTVYTHRKKIMRKLKVNSASELVLYAVNNGILEKKISIN